MLTKRCKKCDLEFKIDEFDAAFYREMAFQFDQERIEIPAPTHCPSCRLQRRLALRNQNFVSRQKLSTTGENVFSQFMVPPPFPIVSSDEWWGEHGWSPEDFGREFDFSRPFFDQFRDLSRVVPRPATNGANKQNSEYCNNCSDAKNCYFVFDAGVVEDCLYCDAAARTRDCIDCTFVADCERCYDCTSCTGCYNLQSSEDCTSCSDSFFLRGCRSCRSCFGCVNLRQQKFMIFNKQVTPDEYSAFVSSLRLDCFSVRSEVARKVHRFWQQEPRPHIAASRIEGCTGNHLHGCRNVVDSYVVHESEDLRYCFNIKVKGARRCHDYYCWGEGVELLYECTVVGNGVMHCAFCDNCWNGSTDLLYCNLCHGATSCFGCISLGRRSYCILNKQYSKPDYYKLAVRIARHMQETGEWGEFFPMNLSPHPYNITLAQRYFPLSQDDAQSLGLSWWAESAKDLGGAIDANALPDGLLETDSPIVVLSQESRQPFRITKQEIKVYRQFNVPLPRCTYNERMEKRAKNLGGLVLAERKCEVTGQLVQTVYADVQNDRIYEKETFEKLFSS